MRTRETLGVVAFFIALGAAISCTEVRAKEPAQPQPIAQARVGPTQVLYKFAERGDCAPGEFIVAFTNVANQQVVMGCGHIWGKKEYFLFSDGDLGVLDSDKWKMIGAAS